MSYTIIRTTEKVVFVKEVTNTELITFDEVNKKIIEVGATTYLPTNLNLIWEYDITDIESYKLRLSNLGVDISNIDNFITL